MDKLFKEKAIALRIYTGKETIVDPIEKNVETYMLNPIPLKAIVTDLAPTQVQWKMPGIVTNKAKEIIIKKNRKNLIELSQKIEILGDSILYEGWKINGKLQYREEGKYLRCYIYAKQI